MKTKTINLYRYEELSETAKEKALSDFNDNNQMDYLSEDLTEQLKEKLKEENIEFNDIKLYYSLSYCQGDGLCFIGNFKYKDKWFKITHDNSYYYYSSVNIEMEEEHDENDDLENDVRELINTEIEHEFKLIYHNICKQLEENGYKQIEYENSEENFKEVCDINDYYFNENGGLE